MKTNIKYVFILFSLLFFACEDFLDEENKTGKTEDIVFSTAEDIENLAAASYAYLRTWYGKEGGIGYSETGTDLFYEGSDPHLKALSSYTSLTPDASAALLNEYWEMFYSALNLVNTALKYIDESGLLTEDRQTTLEGEMKFLRAFYYWHMVETWGPVTINTAPVSTINFNPERNTVDEVYTQMFDDVEDAINNLDPSELPSSRVTYWAARALKARLALYYASEYNKTSYYDIAESEAMAVINASAEHGKSLINDCEKLWSMDNDNATTKINQEWLWGVDYYNELGSESSYNALPTRLTTNDNGEAEQWSGEIIRRPLSNGSGAGNVSHLLFTPIWHDFAELSFLLDRSCGDLRTWYTEDSPNTEVMFDVGYHYVKYSMGYCRYAPTRYLLDLYEENIDQRYNATFRTSWEKHPDVIPEPGSQFPNCQDTALFWSKHELTDAQKTWASTRYLAVDVTTTFEEDGITPTTTGRAELKGVTFYPAVRKYENTQSQIESAAFKFQDYFSTRDVPVFRMAEMYLIAAEALSANSKSGAYDIMLQLANNRAVDGDGANLLSAYNVNGDGDIDIEFILDERARELCTEYQRWFDLKRTNTLEQRVVSLNPDVDENNFDANKNYLRPIPIQQMNAVKNASETVGEGFWQNPGY